MTLAGGRVGAQDSRRRRGVEQLVDLLDGQLVRRQVLGHARRGLAVGRVSEVRPVAADPDHDVLVPVSGIELIPRASIVAEALGHHLLQPAGAGRCRPRSPFSEPK